MLTHENEGERAIARNEVVVNLWLVLCSQVTGSCLVKVHSTAVSNGKTVVVGKK